MVGELIQLTQPFDTTNYYLLCICGTYSCFARNSSEIRAKIRANFAHFAQTFWLHVPNTYLSS